MTNEAEAREVHATETSSDDTEEQVNGDQAERPDVPGEDDEMIDPDAVIVEAEVISVDDDEDDEDDEDSEDEPHPDAAAAHTVADDVTTADSTPDDVAASDAVPDAAPEVSAATGRAPLSAVTADSAPAGRHALDETPPDGIPPVTAPYGATSSALAGPAPSVPSAPPTGAARSARPGLPNNADVSAPADMAGDPEQLHERWAAIQSTFVDDPHGSVVAAADLVTGAIAALVASVEEQERGLRGEWDHDDVDTEGLRNALRGYRGLLDRLVTH
jgi:hypothetical protein